MCISMKLISYLSTPWIRFALTHSKRKITEKTLFLINIFYFEAEQQKILLRKVYAVAATTKKYQLTKNVCVSSSQAVGTSTVLIGLGFVCCCYCSRIQRKSYEKEVKATTATYKSECIHTASDECTYDSHLHARTYIDMTMRLCVTVYFAMLQTNSLTNTHKRNERTQRY